MLNHPSDFFPERKLIRLFSLFEKLLLPPLLEIEKHSPAHPLKIITLLSIPSFLLYHMMVDTTVADYLYDNLICSWVITLINLVDIMVNLVFNWPTLICLGCFFLHTRTYGGIQMFTKTPYVEPEVVDTNTTAPRDAMEVEDTTPMTPAERAAVLPIPAPEKEQRVSTPPSSPYSDGAGSELIEPPPVAITHLRLRSGIAYQLPKLTRPPLLTK